jgi:hypothetical protein
MSLRPWAALACTLVCAAIGCAASSPKDETDVTVVRHIDRVSNSSSSVPLAGARCQGRANSCRCRQPGDDAEKVPPAEGMKRLELRLSARHGQTVLESPSLGRFLAVGPQETCFYIDVPAGTQNQVVFSARADSKEQGIAPRLQLAEYGPKGPWWYDILIFECVGSEGRCNRQGVETWATRTLSQRKRGRLDACGSGVVSQLRWDTSGGLSERDGGFFSDLAVKFDFEVKKFATQFAPGSTECVPK